MKRILFAAVLFVVAFAPGARAQEAAVAEYYDQWTPRQWNRLEKQLLTSLRAPVQEIDQTVLQNVIYFETHYPEAMQLERGAQRLLRLYRQHPDAQIRILAISALHAVSEPEAMASLAGTIRHEKSPIARHVGTAAVVDFYRGQDLN